MIYYLSILYSNDTSDALFLLGVYVTALLRLMPSINMLYLSGQHILFGKSSLEILEKELTNKSIFSDKNIISRKDTFENIPKIIDNINLKNINFIIQIMA